MHYKIEWLLLSLVCMLAGCGSPDYVTPTFAGQTMGTTYSVQLQRMPPNVSETLLAEKISTELENINALMSTYRKDSELVRFNNQQSTDWFPVSPAVAKVVSEALLVSRLSSGAFDITVNPLVGLWGFGAAEIRSQPPSAEEIVAALARIGYQHVEVQINPPALRKAIPVLSIDLSAIAKGYAVDTLADLLEKLGSQNYLVEIGGELRGRGHNTHDAPWIIGIERPDPSHREVYYQLPLCDMAIATSGDYRNFFAVDGRLYSHTIDPRTGKPVRHRLASVSVLAENSMRADALATALLVLGPEAGAALAMRNDIAAVLIEREANSFSRILTPAFKRYLDGYPDATSCRKAR